MKDGFILIGRSCFLPHYCKVVEKIDKAKVLYRSTQKNNYNLDHCWNLLRYQPKWQVHMNNLPTKRKTGCSTVLASNAIDIEENESMSTNLERPLCKKSEKERERKRKREESSPNQFDEKLSNMESDRRIAMIERREAAIRADSDSVKIISLKKKKMKMEIMMLNVDNMNAVQQEYLKSIQIKILEKHRNEWNEMY
ncbi:uncharacterized protein LOC122308785 isoform X1 [Carya illinoinensis]|uniref:uncharacterized protein LOC122308785 isoform X1 n=1 Tax=Carya illinoinensis TaxID=32201 RepID=UPI001C7234A6|nr:uncharacterized protein LOC122308785 isoform X1 [Carya illinoinensis]